MAHNNNSFTQSANEDPQTIVYEHAQPYFWFFEALLCQSYKSENSLKLLKNYFPEINFIVWYYEKYLNELQIIIKLWIT